MSAAPYRKDDPNKKRRWLILPLLALQTMVGPGARGPGGGPDWMPA